MTDEEVLAELERGNRSLSEARSAFAEAYGQAESDVARCWSAHMVAVVEGDPEEKLRWDQLSLDAAEAAASEDDPRAPGLFPTVLANVGYDLLLLARPAEALRTYERARDRLLPARQLEPERAEGWAAGIEHMIGLITRERHQDEPSAGDGRDEVPPTPFVISYYTLDLQANRRFYGEFLGIPLHSHPGLEDVFFLCGTEPVRMQILLPPEGFGQGDQPASSGSVLLGVETSDELTAIRRRAADLGIPEHPDDRQGAPPVARFLDPDGRMVIVQLFDRRHRFHD